MRWASAILIFFVVILCLTGCETRRKLVLCYDPDIIAQSDVIELRPVASFDETQCDMDTIFNVLQPKRFERESYSFCGIVCWAVVEEYGLPICAFHVLEDDKTINVDVLWGDKTFRVSKERGSYFVKPEIDSEATFTDKKFWNIIKGLCDSKKKEFESLEYNFYDGFGD